MSSVGVHDEPTETAIVDYIRRQPETKGSVRSKEIADALGLDYRVTSETMCELEENPRSPVGKKMDLRLARWRIQHE